MIAAAPQYLPLLDARIADEHFWIVGGVGKCVDPSGTLIQNILASGDLRMRKKQN
jgi:hypothetical protein